ncbi:MAG: 50S ribosomal protein L21 [Bacillota bacterium]|nr:50S ribosomal protein L21 [Bacillota bacterium]
MYAIIESGGKQYRAEEGKVIRVEKLPAEKGEKVVFDRVLMLNNDSSSKIGRPYLEESQVEGKVVASGRERKIIVYKYKRKKNYRRKQGHRQPYTDILITGISGL